MNEKRFSIPARFRSMHFALRGIRLMLATQHNAWVHLAISILVVIAGIALHITRGDWCFLVIAIVAVWCAEAMNTAFEFLCDVASPNFHPMVEKAKDVSAGAVLLSAIGAVVVGLLVFVPYLWALVERR